MTRAQIYSLVRHGISAIGGVLIAIGVMNELMLMDIGGAVLAVIALIWSIVDKDVSRDRLEGTIRQLFTAAGAFGLFMTPEKAEAYIGLAVFLAMVVLGQTDKLDRQEQEQQQLAAIQALQQQQLEINRQRVQIDKLTQQLPEPPKV